MLNMLNVLKIKYIKNALVIFLTGALLFLGGQVNTIAAEKQGEFDNLCVMGLAEGKRIKTDCSVNTTFEGKTYCFRTQDAKTEFAKDPKRNLERAKDHYAAGEVARTGDDMGKYSVDDVKSWLEKHIQAELAKNKGVYLLHDALNGEQLKLKYHNIDFMRTLHGYGFFPEVIFSAQTDSEKKYLVDFWVKPKDGQLALFDVRIYKSPKKENGKWTLVKRQPKPWWWIPASEHPGESEQKRSWEVISAIETHIMIERAKHNGVYKLKDDKTGEDVEIEFVGVHQPVRKLKDSGKFFACSDFRKKGSSDMYYDIDFWLDEKSGNISVGSVRVHKVPEVRDGDVIQVPRFSHDPSKVEVVP
jgi:YHS domain-containing protein